MIPEEKRHTIIALLKIGKTRSQIFEFLKPNVSRSGVYKICKRFETTGSSDPIIKKQHYEQKGLPV